MGGSRSYYRWNIGARKSKYAFSGIPESRRVGSPAFPHYSRNYLVAVFWSDTETSPAVDYVRKETIRPTRAHRVPDGEIRLFRNIHLDVYHVKHIGRVLAQYTSYFRNGLRLNDWMGRIHFTSRINRKFDYGLYDITSTDFELVNVFLKSGADGGDFAKFA